MTYSSVFLVPMISRKLSSVLHWQCLIILGFVLCCSVAKFDFFKTYLEAPVPLHVKVDNEKGNYDAITKIHSHLDDDRNGNVDIDESNEVGKRLSLCCTVSSIKM